MIWRSPDGESNALELRAQYHSLFGALGEIDALGHRTLARLGSAGPVHNDTGLVITALTRRSITAFAGARHLMEGSLVEPAKLPARALFETHVALRYILFGGQRRVTATTPSNPRRREARARFYFVSGERKRIYNRQGVLDGRWGGTRLSQRERRALSREVQSEVARLEKKYPVQSKRFGRYQCFNRRKADRYYYDRPTWYSFGFRKNKVNSLARLADRMGMRPQYEILYSAFSGVAHPSGIHHDVNIALGPSGRPVVEVLHPHLAEGLELLAFYATSWQQLNLQWIARCFLPNSLEDTRQVLTATRPVLHQLGPGNPLGFV